jgi:PIN domain nuclease of toxin-antitoxin system
MPNAEADGPLLLDTHCWVWTEFGLTDRFSRAGLAGFQEAAKQRLLLVSVISIWEIGMLVAKGRIKLFMPSDEWVKKALATPGLTLAPLTPEIALDSSRLPGQLHGDPADRILVAMARRMGARILTKDQRLIAYGRQGHVRVVRA